MAYIEQLLTPEQRQLEGRERIRAIENVQRLAHDTNRAFTGLMVGWLVLGFLSVFILTWALHGAWVADHLMRSQRHPLSRFLTSLELIMLTLAFALFFLIVVGVTITVNSPNVIGGPSWWSRLMPLVGGIAILIVAHLGVVRYWHPGLRIGGYLGIVTLASTIMWLAGCFS